MLAQLRCFSRIHHHHSELGDTCGWQRGPGCPLPVGPGTEWASSKRRVTYLDVYSLHSVKSMLCIEALHPLPPPRPCHLSGHTCFSHRQSSVGEDGLSIVLTTGHWCWEQTQFCLLGVTTAKFYGNWQKVGKTVRAKGDGGCRGPLPSIGVFAVTLKKGRLPGGSVGSASHLPRAIGRRVRDPAHSRPETCHFHFLISLITRLGPLRPPVSRADVARGGFLSVRPLEAFPPSAANASCQRMLPRSKPIVSNSFKGTAHGSVSQNSP